MSETLLEELTFKVGELATQVYDLKNDKYEMVKDLYEALYGYRLEFTNDVDELWNDLLSEVNIRSMMYEENNWT